MTKFNEIPKLDKTARTIPGSFDLERSEKRAWILGILEPWVLQEKTKDPNFNITEENLEKFRTSNEALRSEVRSTGAILRYFDRSLKFLRVSFGLPEKLGEENTKPKIRTPEFLRRKAFILKYLRPWVAKQISGNDNFLMNDEQVLRFLADHREVFPGIPFVSTVTHYFDRIMRNLNKELGLIK